MVCLIATGSDMERCFLWRDFVVVGVDGTDLGVLGFR